MFFNAQQDFRLFLMYISKNTKRAKFFKNKKIKLLSTFILENSIKKRKYIDRYYNSLEEHIEKKEFKDLYILPTIIPFYISNKILNKLNKNSKFNMLYQSDFLMLSDYLNSFFYHHSINKKIINKECLFNGISTSEYLLNFLNIKYDLYIIRALLNYNFIYRLKQHNVDVSLFIIWYENQAIDKSYLLSLYKNFPNAYSKGYQGYFLSKFSSFYFQPTQGERFLNMVPKEINCTGKGMINIIKVAPAFRFNKINKVKIEFIKDLKILVLLPIDLKTSTGIVQMIINLINDHNISIENFILKPHPVTNINDIFKNAGVKENQSFTIEKDPIYKCILKYKLSIGTNSSSLIESLACARPCIILNSANSLNDNCIPQIINNKIYSSALNTKELYKKIYYFDYFIDENKSFILKEALSLRSNFFSEISDKEVRKFLNSE